MTLPRMTKKWILENVKLQKNALPGSVHFLDYSEAAQNAIDNDWQHENYNDRFESKLTKRLEKLGYIENRGCMVLTQNGYRTLHSI